jgi:hypothetical protein
LASRSIFTVLTLVFAHYCAAVEPSDTDRRESDQEQGKAHVKNDAKKSEDPAEGEVPRMSSDMFYGFDARTFREQMKRPDKPLRDKWFRSTYEVVGDGLEIDKGSNLFNRPLFTPGCRTLVTAGDRPALILWTSVHYPKPGNTYFGKPDWLGHLFVGLAQGGKSKWFHEFAECRTHFHPGWIEYQLQDPMFPGMAVRLEILPSPTGAVWFNTEITARSQAAAAPTVLWTHGCIGYTAESCWKDSYDCSARVPFTWDEPQLADNDRVEFQDGLAILRDAGDLANWVAVGSNPKPAELFVTNAENRLAEAPGKMHGHAPAGKPAAAGSVALTADGGRLTCSLIINWGRDSDPKAAMQPLIAQSAAQVAEAKRHFEERISHVAITTPDTALDTAFRFATVAADGMWHPPGINHSPFSWGALTTIFRIYYGLTCCGDHDRVASALRLHGHVNDAGHLLNLVSAVGQQPVDSGYESYGSTVDMLWQHFLWSNDRALLTEWKPIVDALIQHEERDRKSVSGLFIDKLGFWCSDSFHYEEGSAVGSVFVWRMYLVRGWMAAALGEDPAPFQRRADEIKELIFGTLWSEDEGFLHDSLGVDGRQKPTTIAPIIYHAIEYGLVTERKAERMFDWMITHLQAPSGLIRVNDWSPINWSHNVYSPNETGNAAVAAFELRRGDSGHAMLHGIARGTIERTLIPGAIMCVSNSDGAQNNGGDFGDGVSLFLRATIEGLFGIRMNRPQGVVRMQPNFPADWDRAEITLPDLGSMRFRKAPDGEMARHTYSITLKTPLRISASLPAAEPARDVRVDGKPVEPARAGKFVELDIPACAACEISFAVSAAAERSAQKPASPAAAPAKHTVKLKDSAHAQFQTVALDGAAPIPFAKAFKLFPGEQVWNMVDNSNYRFLLDRRFTAGAKEVRITRQRIPFLFDEQHILAFKKKHENAQWTGFKLDFPVEETLSIPIGKRAQDVYLLAAGLCSVMTYTLPQVEIALEYEDGQVIRRQLTAPDDFDFITQHTTTHQSVAVGWMATQGLDELEKERAASGDPLFKINDRLHADVILLKGVEGKLKQITFTPLQRHSGMIVFAVTLANGRQ